MKDTFFPLLIFLFSHTVSGQSLTIFDIKADAFPNVKAKFYAFDGQDNQVRPQIADMEVMENGTALRTITNISCPPPENAGILSAVISVDVSGSMKMPLPGGLPIGLAKTTALGFCDGLKMPESQAALQACNSKPYILQDFTTNKDKIKSLIEPLKAEGENDFIEHLLNPLQGLLNIAKTGKNRRVAVLLTDAWWRALKKQELKRCLDTCLKYDIRFYAVIYSEPDAEPDAIKSSLIELAEATGGLVFDGIVSAEAAAETGKKILRLAHGAGPCEISWKSESACELLKTAVEMKWLGKSSAGAYTPQKSANTRFAFGPGTVYFKSKPPGIPADTTVTILAMNGSFNVAGISSSNPAYTITPVNFKLAQGESRSLKITYTPANNSYTWTKFTFKTDRCEQYYYASAGTTESKPGGPALKLTHPDGGEKFLAGSDTIITWANISAEEPVSLHYSIDNGANWKLLSEKAKGLRYEWKNVPPPASNNCLVRVSQVNNHANDPVYTLTGHTAPLTSVEWAPDDNTIATGSADHTCRIWDAKSGSSVKTLMGHLHHVSDVAWKPGVNILATGSTDNIAKIWSVATSTTTAAFVNPAAISGIAWSPDGTRLATAGTDHKIHIWDMGEEKLLKTLGGHTNRVLSIDWSPDGSKIVSCSYDRSVKVWDVNTASNVNSITHGDVVNSVRWSPDGSKVAFGTADNTAKIWEITTGSVIKNFSGHASSVTDIAWSPDGTKLATASADRTAKIWDISSAVPMKELKGHGAEVTALSWNGTGSRLATASADKTAKIWIIEELPLQSDTSDGLFSIVIPEGRVADMDMGRVLTGTKKDSVIQALVSCTGDYPFTVDTIYFKGPDAGAFSLVGGFPSYMVAPGKSRKGELRFTPTRTGQHTAEIFAVTKADTLRARIRGEGIKPVLTIVNDLIDFGQVNLGNKKDSLQALTIKNTGNSKLTVTSTYHEGPNSVDFSTVAGGGSFILQPGATARLDLRFRPSEEGRTTGRLQFAYDGPGSPATIQLFGEGTDFTVPQIQAEPLQTILEACAYEKTATIKITNSGKADLSISKAVITGENSEDFSFPVPFTPFTLPPFGEHDMQIRFRSDQSGARKASLNITSNSQTESILSLPLEGFRESAAYSVDALSIDLGAICPEATKDTVITFINTGNMSGSIKISADQLLSVTDALLMPVPGGEAALPVSFKGRKAAGPFSQKIILTDTCGYKNTITISGEIAAPQLSCNDIVFTSVKKDETAEKELIITNSGNRDALIGIMPDISPFVFADPGIFPLTVKAGESIAVTIRYQAADTLFHTAGLDFAVEPCGSSLHSKITSMQNGPSIAADGLSFIAGSCDEKVYMTLELRNAGNEELSISSAKIAGEDKTSFAFDKPFSGLTLAPGSMHELVIIFQSEKTGTSLAEVELESNSMYDALLSLPLEGIKESTTLIAATDHIDLGEICPGTAKDTLVKITSTGTIDYYAHITTSPFISTEAGVFLPAAESAVINITFDAPENEGFIEQSLTVSDSCGRQTTVRITASVRTAVLEADNISITDLIGGGPTEKEVIIHNKGTADAIIDGIADISPFTLADPSIFPLTIPAGNSAAVGIRYEAQDAAAHKVSVDLAANPCGTTTIMEISGSGNDKPSILCLLEGGKVAASSGETISFPIYLSRQAGSPQQELKAEFRIRFNASLLEPVEGTSRGFVEEGLRHIDMSITLAAGEDSAVIYPRFRAALGNDSTSAVRLTIAGTDTDGLTEIMTRDGEFRLNDLCYSGGARLLNPSGKTLLKLSPNPTADKTEIEMETAESGFTTLELFDLRGLLVRTFMNEEIAKGKRIINASFEDMPSGVYLLRMVTATTVNMIQLRINK